MQREHDIQCACVAWFRLCYRRRGYLIASIVNEGARSPRMGAWYKDAGLLPGFADLVVVLDRGAVVWVELKTAKGRQSPAQRSFQRAVELLGHTYLLCRGFDEFRAAVSKIVENHEQKR